MLYSPPDKKNKMKKIGLLMCVLTHIIFLQANSNLPADFNYSCYPFVSLSYQKSTEVPVAVNDTFLLAAGCSSNSFSGNLLANDSFETDAAWLSHIDSPNSGNFSCGPQGNFVFNSDPGFRGEISLRYRLSDIVNSESFSEAWLTLIIDIDSDCDQVVNSIDIDDDNDGILDVHEGDEQIDTDNDGIPDSRDIDSDNDGITDFEEWQNEGFCKSLLLCDNNRDGWDDAFDPAENGDYYEQTDTDMDGIPDFRDTDSDNDGISDFIEAFDTNNDQIPEWELDHLDHDSDGLDNSCDTLQCGLSRLNPMGSNSPLPDNDKNNIRNWRDPHNYSIDAEPQFAKTGNDELFVYPNPVVDQCLVVLPPNDNMLVIKHSLKLYDSKGSLVHLDLFTGGEKQLSLGHLKKGMYILRVKIGTKTLITRINKTGLH